MCGLYVSALLLGDAEQTDLPLSNSRLSSLTSLLTDLRMSVPIRCHS